MSYRPICDTWVLARPKVKYYGAYPSGFLSRARALLGVGIMDTVAHVCSGRVQEYPYDGVGPNDVTIDVNVEANPQLIVDITKSDPQHTASRVRDFVGQAVRAVLADPPYTAADATHYGTEAILPTARYCLTWGLDLLPAIGGRVGILHYVAPRPPKGVKFIACISVFVGFENRVRLYSVYEKQ